MEVGCLCRDVGLFSRRVFTLFHRFFCDGWKDRLRVCAPLRGRAGELVRAVVRMEDMLRRSRGHNPTLPGAQATPRPRRRPSLLRSSDAGGFYKGKATQEM
eukprot:Rhum_TRINITY_DN14356_c3_g1::Rhum_TRINITY_DN14356_c3_g1_i1::g.84561::m.84561